MTAKSNAREGDGVAGLPPLPEAVSEVFAEDGEGYGWITPGKCYYTPDQMRAYALAAMQAQQGAEPVAWQPIESAPLGDFLVCIDDWVTAAYRNQGEPIKSMSTHEPFLGVPTLWQPLPAAPATGAPR